MDGKYRNRNKSQAKVIHKEVSQMGKDGEPTGQGEDGWIGCRAGIREIRKPEGQVQDGLRIGIGSGQDRCRLKVKITGSKIRAQGERHQGKDVRACQVFIRLQ